MTSEWTIHEVPGGRILEYPAKGAPLGNVLSSLEMIGAARGHGAGWIAGPWKRLGDAFFQLRNGIAGEVLQRFVTYQLRMAVVGEIAPFCAASKALHDFVVECNRGIDVWFVGNLGELRERLRTRASQAESVDS